MEKDKTQVFNFFKKLTKVYNDVYIAKNIAKHLCFFEQKKGEQSIFEWLNSMEEKRIKAVGNAVKTIYLENNKARRPFVACGNFAIKFDEIIEVLKTINERTK